MPASISLTSEQEQTQQICTYKQFAAVWLVVDSSSGGYRRILQRSDCSEFGFPVFSIDPVTQAARIRINILRWLEQNRHSPQADRSGVAVIDFLSELERERDLQNLHVMCVDAFLFGRKLLSETSVATRVEVHFEVQQEFFGTLALGHVDLAYFSFMLV